MNREKRSLSSSALDSLFKQQEYKYIKLFSYANPQIAQDIKELKLTYANEKYSLDDSPYNKYSIVH
jgi:chloramphenicol O-acetyltransferase